MHGFIDFSCTSCVDTAVRRSASVTVTRSFSGNRGSFTDCTQLRRTKLHDAPVSISMSSHHTPSSCPRVTIVLFRSLPLLVLPLDALTSCTSSSGSRAAYRLDCGSCADCALCCLVPPLVPLSLFFVSWAALLLLVFVGGFCDEEDGAIGRFSPSWVTGRPSLLTVAG